LVVQASIREAGNSRLAWVEYTVLAGNAPQ